MKTLIIGGTGLLGYHAILELLKRGHTAAAVAIPDAVPGDWFPPEASVAYGDVFAMNPTELKELFRGYDAMVYAVGPDDRVTPKAPAHEFFHERLVEACARVVSAAREAGVRKCVVLNSYFAYFDRIWPEAGLAEHHPYIRCRVEQAERVICEGMGAMDVCVLELPYIFGTMPGRIPLWKDILIEYLRKSPVVFFPRGGTGMLSAKSVAEAIAGALENGVHGKRYLIGDENMEWKRLLGIMLDEMGEKKKIVYIPEFAASLQGLKMKREHRAKGLESGLDPAHLFRDIQCRYLYIDAGESKVELGYDGGGLEDAIRETVRACL
ncbi:MAG: NAD(P)H-binding protein [Clostridia bacterium]